MSIQDITAKFKAAIEDDELFTSVLLILVALVSFWLGRMSVEEAGTLGPGGEDLAVTLSADRQASAAAVVTASDTYVASKNGTKYFLPWCGSAASIKDENKIIFASREEAEKAGYTPAENCKGI